LADKMERALHVAVILPRNLSRQFHQLGQPVQAGTHGIGIVCHALPTVRDGEGFRQAAEAMLRKAEVQSCWKRCSSALSPSQAILPQWCRDGDGANIGANRRREGNCLVEG
jgi:hypothetical protein